MRVNFAHIRERSTSGGWIDFAVFDAKSTSGSNSDNGGVLAELTRKARVAGCKIDQSALAYTESGKIKFYGSKPLVDHLSRVGLPQWTHWLDV